MPKVDNLDGRLSQRDIAESIKCIDLFCGAGGLTSGLESVGINVVLGIDSDPACEYPYTANNKASFLLKSVADVTATDLSEAFGDAQIKLLAGCAPCQPFSTYSRPWSHNSDQRWYLLEHFSRLIQETSPHVVTMENVPPLEREDVFSAFNAGLQEQGYNVSHCVVNCADYEVPQQRKRLVLLASQFGSINIVKPTTPEGHRISVRSAIGELAEVEAGGCSESDPLHRACGLSPLNIKRIRSSKPGGTWRDWDKALVAKCHLKATGKTYASIYGRMTWDEPAPTMTTQFYGYGNGRFGHPEQHRAITLREGAILQSFSETYQFVPKDTGICTRTLGRLIGNAVPVSLAGAIGRSIVSHVREWHTTSGMSLKSNLEPNLAR